MLVANRAVGPFRAWAIQSNVVVNIVVGHFRAEAVQSNVGGKYSSGTRSELGLCNLMLVVNIIVGPVQSWGSAILCWWQIGENMWILI